MIADSQRSQEWKQVGTHSPANFRPACFLLAPAAPTRTEFWTPDVGPSSHSLGAATRGARDSQVTGGWTGGVPNPGKAGRSLRAQSKAF